MNRGDKAALRLAIGLGLAVLVAYGLALPAAVRRLRDGGARAVQAGAAAAVRQGRWSSRCVFAALLAAGVLMVPLLENYALAGVLLTAVVALSVFFVGLRSGNPLTMVLVMVVHADPGGRRGRAGAGRQLSVTHRGRRRSSASLVKRRVARALSPIRPAPSAASGAARVRPTRTARWIALRATLIVMPVFVLALTNPSFYLAAIMKTVALGQQAGETDARSAGPRAGRLDADGRR